MIFKDPITFDVKLKILMDAYKIECYNILITIWSKHIVIKGIEEMTIIKLEDSEFLNDMTVRTLKKNDL